METCGALLLLPSKEYIISIEQEKKPVCFKPVTNFLVYVGNLAS